MTTRALITGATSGLGREAAVQLAHRGWRIAVSGRRRDQLLETARLVTEAGGEPLVLLGSVTEPTEVKAHYATIKAAWGGLDYVVLNAGVGDTMSAAEFSAESVKWTFDANVFGVCHSMEAVIPDMLAQKSGVIAGVASLAGFRGLPQSGPYCASKAALIALLESARVDLIGTGVSIVTVCPGFVHSEMTDRNNPGTMPFLMDTKDGVTAMLAGIDARRRVVHFPWQLSYMSKYLLPAIPDFLYDWIAHKFAPLRVKRPTVR